MKEIALIVLASFYLPTGHLTAYGKLYDPTALVTASDDFIEGTYLTLEYEGKRVRVEVMDKLGPQARKKGRVLDLSPAAFQQLAPLCKGIIQVRITEVAIPIRLWDSAFLQRN